MRLRCPKCNEPRVPLRISRRNGQKVCIICFECGTWSPLNGKFQDWWFLDDISEATDELFFDWYKRRDHKWILV